jgi:hypothetical protein
VAEVPGNRVDDRTEIHPLNLAKFEEVTTVFRTIHDPFEAVGGDAVVWPRLVREVIADEFLLGKVDFVWRFILADDHELALPFDQPEVGGFTLSRPSN